MIRPALGAAGVTIRCARRQLARDDPDLTLARTRDDLFLRSADGV